MADDVLKALGLAEVDDDTVPTPAPRARKKRTVDPVLSALGLAEVDDALSGPTMIGNRKVEDWEITPGAKAPASANVNTSPPASTLSQFRETIAPSRVIPNRLGSLVRNTGEYAKHAWDMVSSGASDIMSGAPASGVGKVGLGGLMGVLSPVAGVTKAVVTEPLEAVTGDPVFADKASMFVPMNIGGRTAAPAIRAVSPSGRAVDEVVKAVGPENVPNMLTRLESNPRLRPIDTNDQLRMAGQGLIASPNSPKASRALTENMRESAANARDAVRGTYDEAMGAPPDLFATYGKLQKDAKAVGLSKIAPPLIAAKPVDTSGVISDIDKVLNPAPVKMAPGTTITPTPLQQKLADIRRDLASGDKEVLTSADRLHEIQSSMRREAEDLMKSPESRRLGRELMDYRGKLVDAIDKAAPGYKEGLKAYKDQKDIERAFQFGRDVLKNTDDLKTDPSFLKQWVNSKDRTAEEIEAARLGARQAIEQKMGSIKMSALDPARSGTDVPQIEFNRRKLEALFGKENTDKMFRHLQDERDIALTNNRGLGNSKTAETQAWQRQLEPRDVARPHSQLPGWALALGTGAGALSGSPQLGATLGLGMLGARGGKSMYDWLARQGDISRNNAIARILSTNSPENRAAIAATAQRLGQRNKLNNLVRTP